MKVLQQNAANAYLIVEQNRRWSDVYRLPHDRPTQIGRSSNCQIVINDDRSSRRHAQIDWLSDHWSLQDLGSRNGTQVDGQTIQGPYRLRDGESIVIGGAALRFTHRLSATGDSAAQPPSPGDSGKRSGAAVDAGATADLSDPAAVIVERQQPRRWITEMAIEMLAAGSLAEAADAALRRLIKRCGNSGGAILEPQEGGGCKVLAAAERPSKAYHRISDFLLRTCLDEGRAVLARNIGDDRQFVQVSSSLAGAGTSVIAVPIFDPERVIGLIHLYSRDDEAELSAETLSDVTAAAEALSVAIPHLQRQGQMQRKLQASRRQIDHLQQRLEAGEPPSEMLGRSASLAALQQQLTRVAASDAAVLLRGESGVGKELAARAVHRQSRRRSKAFVAMNCAALSPMLLESELFGHEKGAFTGATEQKMGKFELADGGTLMLDEVGEMTPETQAKFLRVLEGQPFERVGGNKPIRVEVRIVAATNRDLEAAVKAGEFRADLYFRLRVVEILIPPLRRRREDIVPLAHAFLEQFRTKCGYGPRGFSPAAIAAMEQHAWPGNIRELKNSVERAVVLCTRELAEPDDLALSPLHRPDDSLADSLADAELDQPPRPAAAGGEARGYQELSLADLERRHIVATLNYTGGQKSRAAGILGIERSTLDRKLKRFDEDDAATPPGGR